MDSSIYERYQALLRVAKNDAASPHERKLAEDLADRLVKKYGSEVREWRTLVVQPESPYEVQLLLHSAAHHGCSVRQESPRMFVSGPPEQVGQVEADCTAYAPLLHAFLTAATLSYLRGVGVYTQNQREGATSEVAAPDLPRRALQAMVSGARQAEEYAQATRRADLTRKQLPAPRRQSFISRDLEEFLRVFHGFR